MTKTTDKIRTIIKAGKAQREAERKRLMKLSKPEIVEMYLTIRFDKIMVEQYAKPVLDRGLNFEKQLRENQEKSAKIKFENGLKNFATLLEKNNIRITRKSTAGQIEKLLSTKGTEPIPDLKTIRNYLNSLNKKGS